MPWLEGRSTGRIRSTRTSRRPSLSSLGPRKDRWCVYEPAFLPAQPSFHLRLDDEPGLSRRAGRALEKSFATARLDVTVCQPDEVAPVAPPIVVFSHGFHGCATQSRFLMTALAAAGYLVVAPNHRDATCNGGSARWIDRPEWRFGLIGHSLGGYTVLGLGGASVSAVLSLLRSGVVAEDGNVHQTGR